MKRVLKLFLLCMLICVCITGCDDKDTSLNDDNKKPITKHSIQIEVNCESNLFFSRYDIEVFVDDESQGIIEHGQSDIYELSLKEGNHELTISKEGDSSVDGYVIFNVEKEESFRYKVHCTSDQIEIEEYAENDDNNSNENDETNKISVTMNEDELIGMTTADAEKRLKDMGFTVLKYETLDTDDKPDLDGKIGAVEIKSWDYGKGDFSKGDKYESNAIVVLWSYKYTEPAKASPVFYSTNDYETATKGKSGVFSYKNKGGSYDVYWIIDFEEGYVYFFTDGNNEAYCDKVKIVSGTLNDRVKVTWHDGGEQWSWYLHFKYANSPVTLIVNDHNGFTTEFTTTDLDDALALRNTKTIIKY